MFMTSKRSPSYLIATVGGVGLIPVAPGTAGSIVGALVWCVMVLLLSPEIAICTQLVLLLIILPVGTWASAKVEKTTGKIDSSEIVIDETAGMLITLFALPFSWFNLLVGFALFRLLDIIKPFPIGRLQKLKGGLGVMADDIAAGLASAVIVRLLVFLTAFLTKS